MHLDNLGNYILDAYHNDDPVRSVSERTFPFGGFHRYELSHLIGEIRRGEIYHTADNLQDWAH